MAAREGCSSSAATDCRLEVRYNAAIVVRTAVSTIILPTESSFFLVNRLPNPESGLSRLKSGIRGLRLFTHPPDVTDAAMAAVTMMPANATQPASPMVVASPKRRIIEPELRIVPASNESCRPKPCRSCSNRIGANASTAAAPAPSTAKCDKSSERLTCPSSCALRSLRSVAGRLRS